MFTQSDVIEFVSVHKPDPPIKAVKRKAKGHTKSEARGVSDG